jgi:hypothetical protein
METQSNKNSTMAGVEDKIALNIWALRIEVATCRHFIADVDIPIKTKMSNPDGIGVVIGVESYQYVSPATYAYNDAEVFREYLSDTLGYKKSKTPAKANSPLRSAARPTPRASCITTSRLASRGSLSITPVMVHPVAKMATAT